MLSLLKYYRLKHCHPRLEDFVSMGLGIQARYLRCKGFWKGHLSCCREFQEKALSSWSGGRLLVLGAGRLLDVDLPFLLSKFEHITFIDADPGAIQDIQRIPELKAAGEQVSFLLEDLTGSLESWTAALQAVLGEAVQPERLAVFLSELRPKRPAQLKGDVILSLNLLGQIPIYWRDRVQSMVLRHWKIDTDADGKYPAKLQAALDASCRVLQSGHLEMLQSSQAKKILLIHDREYCYYQSTHAAWRVEPALYVSAIGAAFASYSCHLSDAWLWHIAPQGIENKHFGEIHVVEARSFTQTAPIDQV